MKNEKVVISVKDYDSDTTLKPELTLKINSNGESFL